MGGAWDPMGLSTTQERFDKFRTCEIKHGRVAMMAILGSFFQHGGGSAITGFGTPPVGGVPAGMAGFMDPNGSKGLAFLIACAAFLELGPWADAFAKSPG